MSFLFGKKKPPPQGAAPAPRDTHSANASSATVHTGNGSREKERSPGAGHNTTPGSSINNSLNSLEKGPTPSPEHGSGNRGGSEPDGQVQQYGPRPGINGPTPSGGNPNSQPYPWSQRRLTFTTSQPNPFPRYGAAVNAISSKEGDVYLMGGLVNGIKVKGDLWMIEAGSASLACYPISTAAEGPGPRVGHASLLVGNAFIIFGGDTKLKEGDALDDTLYLLNTSTRQWSRAMPSGSRPAGRYGHTLNILGSKIYIFGGQVEGHFFNHLIAFDLNALQDPNNRWELLVPDSLDGGPPDGEIPPGRTNHTIVSWMDKLYLFGGTNGTHWFNDVWSYDPRTNLWSQLDCIGYIPAPREGHSAALVDDVMYIFGGRSEEGNDLGDLAAFRITSRRWYTFQNMGISPSPRSGHSMTAYGKQIVVLAGEPSSAAMDPGELSLVYVLDTAKIRYPNDQQIQQTPTGERVPGNRRPSTEKSTLPQNKGVLSRDPSAAPDGPKRLFSGSRENIAGGPGPAVRGQETGAANPPNVVGPGSRLPRVTTAQAPSGPPPQQQAPQPRINGVMQGSTGPRSRTPIKENRPYGPLDTSRAASFERQDASPAMHENMQASSNRAMSPTANGITPSLANGRRTPIQQPSRVTNRSLDEEEHPGNEGPRSRSRQGQPQPFVEQSEAALYSNEAQKRSSPNQYDGVDDTSISESVAGRGPDTGLVEQLETTTRELDAAKIRNAWYASELELARKAGYHQDSSRSPALEDSATHSLGETDHSLVEALLAMRKELADVQSSVESRVQEAAQKVFEVEQQRDAAIREATFAKAKYAAQGGSKAGTSEPDDTSRGLADSDRSMDMARKLGSALILQDQLRSKANTMAVELESERRARELAEASADAAHRTVAELKQGRHPGEIDGLRAELHQAEKTAREEAAQRADAQVKIQLLEVDKEELSHQLEDAMSNSKAHITTLGSLREAVAASNDKSSLLARKLDEEREHRENVERKLLQLKSEHEERTGELETTTRKLRDAEELADKHSTEAQLHRKALLSGLDKLNARGPDDHRNTAIDERVAILQRQVKDANALVRKNQADADNAAEKLRRAEERIAGLEAYQEQASHENLSIRRQLQDAVRETQTLQAQNTEVRQQLDTHKRDAGALAIQHTALKELLNERPPSGSGHDRSQTFDGPGERHESPDRDHVHYLEQQLIESQKAYEENRAAFEAREQEADRAYREKLEQLEHDYQSAVYYVKGTEKMLKIMKDELAKYKDHNARLQSELEDTQRTHSARSIDAEPPADWENERQLLKREIEEMQESVKGSISQLENQMEEVRSELRAVQEERDHYRAVNVQAQQQLNQVHERAQSDLNQLRNENARLETRAADAEHKVSLLLDQVESSVDNYRRQSQLTQPGGYNHTRNASTNSNINLSSHSHNNSIGADSGFSTTAPDNRNSVALDSLASELETLRTQWEGTHRTYRLSSQFDFERTPTTATGGELSDSLASWRRRLDAEERDKENSRSPVHSPTGGLPNGRVASPRGGEMEKERARGGLVSPFRKHGDESPLNVI